MELTSREFWTALHGMIFGAGFLLVFSAGWISLWNLRPNCVAPAGEDRAVRQATAILWIMSSLAWIAVLMGTWIIYPGYRAKPDIAQPLAHFPKYFLLASPATSEWHEFGMEWKEHLAWLVPILATAVAAAVSKARTSIIRDAVLRRTLLAMYAVAFGAAAIAGLLGALINKAAPIR